MMTCYHPEMNEARPADTQIDATLAHGGKHWFLKTALVLKGRGIEHLRTFEAKDLVPQAQYRVGQHEYKVTDAAFENIQAQYKVAGELLL